jgi:cytochrome c-type biogenesis protein CcmH
MIFWLIAGILTFGVVLAIVWPIINGAGPTTERGSYGLRVYRDQLDELERDHEQGRIGDDELTAARIEIQRRMLAADSEARAEADTPSTENDPAVRSQRMLAVVLLVFFIPAGALAAYVSLGRPDLPNRPYADRAAERLQAQQARAKVQDQVQAQGQAGGQANAAAPKAGTVTGAAPRGLTSEQMAAAQTMSTGDRQATIQSMVKGLAARLEKSPGDIEGWIRLGRSYEVLERPQDALKAYAHAAAQAPKRVDAQMTYARALFPQGTSETAIPEAFKAAIHRVLNLEPALAEAMFYGGVIAASEGDTATARDLWSRLLKRMDADAPATPILEQRLKALQPD